MKFYKYHGAGNDFLLADNRDGSIRLSREQIAWLCNRRLGIGSDGLMLLDGSSDKDFRMEFFNPDGSSGMMCGNGGRCIAAFAARMGIPAREGRLDFEAPDGPHTALFLDGEEDSAVRTVRLRMKDVAGIERHPDGWFLDTGTRHFVQFVEGLHEYPVFREGKRLRGDPRFAPAGTNVDFVEPEKGVLHIRTFEKGVEDETLACGTGIVAAAMVACSRGIPPTRRALTSPDFPDARRTPASPDFPPIRDVPARESVSYAVRAAIAGLQVDFTPSGDEEGFRATGVWLTGPATFVACMEIFL